MKKIFYLLMISGLCFLFYKKQDLIIKEKNKMVREVIPAFTKKIVAKISKEVARKISKEKKNVQTAIKKRIKKEGLREFKLLKKRIIASFPSELATKVTFVAKTHLNLAGKKISAFKTLIEHQNNQGLKSSYHALIDEQTGRMIMSFDRPHTNFLKRASLRYSGQI